MLLGRWVSFDFNCEKTVTAIGKAYILVAMMDNRDSVWRCESVMLLILKCGEHVGCVLLGKLSSLGAFFEAQDQKRLPPRPQN